MFNSMDSEVVLELQMMIAHMRVAVAASQRLMGRLW
jgi:hypothetical protein